MFYVGRNSVYMHSQLRYDHKSKYVQNYGDFCDIIISDPNRKAIAMNNI